MARSLALLCWATVAFAEEKPAPPPPASPPENTIESARRDLDAIKAARSGMEQPRAELPHFSTPELQIGPGAPPRMEPRLTPAEAAAAKKSANWLVDAMMKKPSPGSDGRDRRSGDRMDDGDRTEPRGVTGGANLEARVTFGDAAQRPASTKPVDPSLNPLTGFMAGWMSAQDYKLLQPGMGAESAANLIARGESSSYRPPATGGAAGAASLPGAGRPPPARSASVPRENPFLQAATPPLAPTANPTGTPPPKPTAAIPSQKVPPPPEPPPQKSATPDFVKPNDDAKYFKPLKRF